MVANSWDADATNVYIEIEKDVIIITDDGHGMTLNDINNKYLLVGYPRRIHNEAVTDRYKRKVMGRKGIGKLSLFSIAETITVETNKEGEKNGFVMSKQDIDDHIEEKNEQPYEPKSLPESEIVLTENGTRIVLTDLKKRITKARYLLFRGQVRLENANHVQFVCELFVACFHLIHFCFQISDRIGRETVLLASICRGYETLPKYMNYASLSGIR